MKCLWQRNTQNFMNGGQFRRWSKEGARLISHWENKRAIYRMNGKFWNSADFQGHWVPSTNICYLLQVYSWWDCFTFSSQSQAVQTQSFKVWLSLHLITAPMMSSLASFKSPSKCSYTGAYRGQLVVNLIVCQKCGWQARLPYSNHTQKTQKSKLLPDTQLLSV